jgi:hypothetical protein
MASESMSPKASIEKVLPIRQDKRSGKMVF